MIIGLCGPPGSGKNAAGLILEQQFGFQQRSIAEALRGEVAAIVLGDARLPEDLIEAAADGSDALQELCTSLLKAREKRMSPWGKPTPLLMRRCLQLWGTDYRRKQDPDYWVRLVEIPTGRYCVITDIRFGNEVELCDVLWYVDRPDCSPVPGHASEGQIQREDCQAIIQNYWGLTEFESQVIDAATRLLMAAELSVA